MAREQVHLIVSGVVQGVGFRAFTLSVAHRAGVVGWVRNRPDGTVEIVAEGEREQLQSFISAIRRGPISARVDNVAEEWREATGEFTTFGLRW